jgi:hypothetical protein
MTRGPIEAYGAEEPGEHKGLEAWRRYLAHADEQRAEELGAAQAAADEQARIRAASEVASAPVPARPEDRGGLSGAAAAAAGAAAAAFQAVLGEHPEDRRMGVMAAMQAEALARLEIAPHADQVQAGQRASDASDPAARAADKDIGETRYRDLANRDPEIERGRPGALRPAPDRVAPAEKQDHRDADGGRERRS